MRLPWSTPLLRNSSKKSMLSLTIVVLLTSDLFIYDDKDDAMVCLCTVLFYTMLRDTTRSARAGPRNCKSYALQGAYSITNIDISAERHSNCKKRTNYEDVASKEQTWNCQQRS